MQQTLGIDIETYSSTDLSKAGVYKYTEADDFEILLFAYCFNDNPVNVIDLKQGDELPGAVMQALTDPKYLKTAHNANFERTCIAKYFNIQLDSAQWECTMAKTSMLGLPLSLDMVAKVLKLEQQKSAAGKMLIKYFSIPCKPTKVNGQRERNLPGHDLEKWEAFKEYCAQDVITEQAIREKIAFFKIPETEVRLWQLDQKINDTGVLVDTEFVNNAILINDEYEKILLQEAKDLTGSDNPNSLPQLKKWLTGETGEVYKTLNKHDVTALLTTCDKKNIERVLQIRRELSKTSVDKYNAIQRYTLANGRACGMFQYYGAGTGRWAGRGPQPQNLTKHKISDRDLDLARNIIRSGDRDLLELLYGDVKSILSQAIRTSFISAPGCRFPVSDFSGIEARVIAWLANEKWRLDVFNTHGKIYEASASQMFKVPIESVTKGSALRNKGKMSELALGYQGGPKAITRIEISNGTPEEDRIPEEELPKLVAMWRNANKAIVKFWNDCNNAAFKAMDGETVQLQKGIVFSRGKKLLKIQLPSGRCLHYFNPQIRDGKFGEVICYEGLELGKWCIQETYGGKLVENIVQAIARDCLADAMIRIDNAGYKIVMHVHDEVVLEVPNGQGSLDEVNNIMSQSIPWAKGLPLTADSYETQYYKKD